MQQPYVTVGGIWTVYSYNQQFILFRFNLIFTLIPAFLQGTTKGNISVSNKAYKQGLYIPFSRKKSI